MCIAIYTVARLPVCRPHGQWDASSARPVSHIEELPAVARVQLWPRVLLAQPTHAPKRLHGGMS